MTGAGRSRVANPDGVDVPRTDGPEPGRAPADRVAAEAPMPHRDATITTVLFDLDGTLLDSIPLLLSGWRHVMTVHRGAPLPDELFLRGVGTPLAVQLAEFARDEAELEALLETYRTRVGARHDHDMRFFPGAAEVVRRLHGAGVPLGVVTSKKRPSTTRGLELLGVLDCVSVLVCADDVRRPKPAPEPVLRALDALEASAETTVLGGDSTHAVGGGRAAGVRTAAALWGPNEREELARHEPTWWLQSPLDVLDLVQPGGARC